MVRTFDPKTYCVLGLNSGNKIDIINYCFIMALSQTTEGFYSEVLHRS